MESQDKEQLVNAAIAGGHPDRFAFDPELGDKALVKVTNKYEVDAYENIFTADRSDPRYETNQLFHSFLPKYYGNFTNQDGKVNIKLENLLVGKPNANILDLKMGTTSITCNTKPDRIELTRAKDAKTTSATLGFRVTGYIIKDRNGQVLEKETKPHGKAKAEQIPGIITKLLKGNELDEINREALEFFRKRAEEMLEYFQNHHSRLIIGSSILLINDNVTKNYEMKIIDLCSSQDYDDVA